MRSWRNGESGLGHFSVELGDTKSHFSIGGAPLHFRKKSEFNRLPLSNIKIEEDVKHDERILFFVVTRVRHVENTLDLITPVNQNQAVMPCVAQLRRSRLFDKYASSWTMT